LTFLLYGYKNASIDNIKLRYDDDICLFEQISSINFYDIEIDIDPNIFPDIEHSLVYLISPYHNDDY
jgi:hypothetical protein